jgi:Putative S-adenosyl-L-methionine-dependent methyltransferase
MAIKENPGDRKTRTSLLLVISSGLCLIFYLLGAWQKSGPGKGDSIAIAIAEKADCATDFPDLTVEMHHNKTGLIDESDTRNFEPCADNFTDYTPCQDQRRAMTFPRGNMVYRERHCPPDEEKIYCLIPAPKGYVAPFRWPKSRDYAAYVNVPYKSLTVEKAIQNWVQFQGNVFRFPGGGTQFPKGADNYIDQLSSVVPIADGTIRTVLDTGCGVCEILELFSFPSKT